MSDLTRITVNLTPLAAEALVKLEAATGDNRTDLLNRSVKLLALMHDLFGFGPIVIQRGDVTERVWFV